MAALIWCLRNWGKLLLLIFLSFLAWAFGYVDSAEEFLGFNSGRMTRVQEIGRLAPFPAERSHLAVKEQFGMFSHMTTIYFVAKPEIIDRWLKDSPGVSQASATTVYSETCYFLGPGRGFLYVTSDHTQVGINLGQAMDGPTHNSPIPLQK